MTQKPLWTDISSQEQTVVVPAKSHILVSISVPSALTSCPNVTILSSPKLFHMELCIMHYLVTSVFSLSIPSDMKLLGMGYCSSISV